MFISFWLNGSQDVIIPLQIVSQFISFSTKMILYLWTFKWKEILLHIHTELTEGKQSSESVFHLELGEMIEKQLELSPNHWRRNFPRWTYWKALSLFINSLLHCGSALFEWPSANPRRFGRLTLQQSPLVQQFTRQRCVWYLGRNGSFRFFIGSWTDSETHKEDQSKARIYFKVILAPISNTLL